jgi:hypothetical protein
VVEGGFFVLAEKPPGEIGPIAMSRAKSASAHEAAMIFWFEGADSRRN